MILIYIPLLCFLAYFLLIFGKLLKWHDISWFIIIFGPLAASGIALLLVAIPYVFLFLLLTLIV